MVVLEENSGADEHWELITNIRRLTCTTLDRLEQGSKDGTLDQAQTRMLGSIALRSLRLWKETLGKLDSRHGAGGKAPEAKTEPARTTGEPEETNG